MLTEQEICERFEAALPDSAFEHSRLRLVVRDTLKSVRIRYLYPHRRTREEFKATFCMKSASVERVLARFKEWLLSQGTLAMLEGTARWFKFAYIPSGRRVRLGDELRCGVLHLDKGSELITYGHRVMVDGHITNHGTINATP